MVNAEFHAYGLRFIHICCHYLWRQYITKSNTGIKLVLLDEKTESAVILSCWKNFTTLILIAQSPLPPLKKGDLTY